MWTAISGFRLRLPRCTDMARARHTTRGKTPDASQALDKRQNPRCLAGPGQAAKPPMPRRPLDGCTRRFPQGGGPVRTQTHTLRQCALPLCGLRAAARQNVWTSAASGVLARRWAVGHESEKGRATPPQPSGHVPMGPPSATRPMRFGKARGAPVIRPAPPPPIRCEGMGAVRPELAPQVCVLWRRAKRCNTRGLAYGSSCALYPGRAEGGGGDWNYGPLWTVITSPWTVIWDHCAW